MNFSIVAALEGVMSSLVPAEPYTWEFPTTVERVDERRVSLGVAGGLVLSGVGVIAVMDRRTQRAPAREVESP